MSHSTHHSIYMAESHETPMHHSHTDEATSAEAILLLLWGIRHQVKEIDRLLHGLIEELSESNPDEKQSDS